MTPTPEPEDDYTAAAAEPKAVPRPSRRPDANPARSVRRRTTAASGGEEVENYWLNITMRGEDLTYLYSGDWTETVLGRSYLRSILTRLPKDYSRATNILAWCYRARWTTFIWSIRTTTVHLDRDCSAAKKIADRTRVEIAVTWQAGIGPDRSLEEFLVSIGGRFMCEHCRTRGPHQGEMGTF